MTKSSWAIYHELFSPKQVFDYLNEVLGSNDTLAVMNKANGSHSKKDVSDTKSFLIEIEFNQ